MRWQGGPLRGEDGGQPDRVQRNFTNLDSRILPARDEFGRGYNGPIAVNATYRVIVAHGPMTNSADDCLLVPLVDGSRHISREKPREISDDASLTSCSVPK